MTATTLPPPDAEPEPTGPLADDADRRRSVDHRWSGRAGGGVLVALLVGGLAFDLAVSHPIGLATATAAVAVVGAAWFGVGARSRVGRVLALSALVPVGFLVVRASVWLAWANLLTFSGLILLAMAVRDEPEPVTAAVRRLTRPLDLLRPVFMAPELVVRSTAVATAPINPSLVQRTARSLAVAVPLAVVLAVLLGSADALFQSVLVPDIGFSRLVGHAVVIGVGAGLMAGLVGHGAWARDAPPPARTWGLGGSELVAGLGATALVYGAFVTTQVVALTAGADYVERTTGLTYAEYAPARLLPAARGRRRVTGGRAALGSAARRGRCSGGGVDGGARTGRDVADPRDRRGRHPTPLPVRGGVRSEPCSASSSSWPPCGSASCLSSPIGSCSTTCRVEWSAAVLGSGLIALVVLNAMNPEAVVAGRNIDRFGDTGDFDSYYVTERLGDDAIPTLVTHEPTRVSLCASGLEPDHRRGTFNLGRHRAADALEAACATG